MPQYETVCVVKPDLQGDRLTKVTDKVKKVLSDHKVETLNKQDWGIRKLAYTIHNHKTAHYLYFTYDGEGMVVNEIERQLSYDDAVLRYLTMKVDKHSRTDIKPDTFQFSKNESESFSHPFGGPRFDRGDRRGGYERRDFREPRGDNRSEGREPRDTTKEES